MMNKTDLAFSLDGDLMRGRGNDLALVHGADYESQIARIRLMVSDPEWIDYKVTEIGANLEDLLGQPNNPDTARKGIRMITHALTKDGVFEMEDLFIKPVPISKYIIQFFVFIDSEYTEKPIGFQVSFNLESGVTVRSA